MWASNVVVGDGAGVQLCIEVSYYDGGECLCGCGGWSGVGFCGNGGGEEL